MQISFCTHPVLSNVQGKWSARCYFNGHDYSVVGGGTEAQSLHKLGEMIAELENLDWNYKSVIKVGENWASQENGGWLSFYLGKYTYLDFQGE